MLAESFAFLEGKAFQGDMGVSFHCISLLSGGQFLFSAFKFMG